VLEFKLYEKRALTNWKEEKTGDYFEVKLYQTELDFGLEFLGKINKFNSIGKKLGGGMMKIYLKPQY
jgi:hypothetical protein